MPASVEYLTTPHDTFNNSYDTDPVAAMAYYSRMMHSHTKQQMDAATRSMRRRSPGSSTVDAQASLSKESTRSSTSSRSSF